MRVENVFTGRDKNINLLIGSKIKTVLRVWYSYRDIEQLSFKYSCCCLLNKQYKKYGK